MLAESLAVSLTMTGEQHLKLLSHLFPGDGKESAAILLCNRRWGETDHELLVRSVVPIPDEGCSERTPERVVWPTRDYLRPLVEEIERRQLGVVIVHSHPSGYPRFSGIDDESDRTLFPSIHGWFDDNGCHVAAVMLPGGEMFGRVVSPEGVFTPLDAIKVTGQQIHLWRARNGPTALASFGERIAQAFGSGTLALLQSLKVGIVGCSGTGSVVFELLLRNGVGKLVLVDPDQIEERNLNRIINSRWADVRAGLPKVEMLRQRASEIGLGTEVAAFPTDILEPEAAQAIASCDVVFGCVDSAEGRHVLNMLATAYLLPYFDLGVHIEPDGHGSISHAVAAVHYVLPGSSLLSRGVYTSEQLTAEAYRRTDPGYYAQNRADGYLSVPGENQPAVISLNMQAAAMAVNDLLARIHHFRLDDDATFQHQKFCLTRGLYQANEVGGHCPIFSPWLGIGDAVLDQLDGEQAVERAG